MPVDRPSKERSPELGALGRLIVYLRTARGASQQDLAKAIGTSPSQVSKWEGGQVEIRPSSREKIAAAFGLSRHDLEELARRVDRIVTWKVRGLESNAKELIPRLDPPALRDLLGRVRLFRRDLEAERADIDRLIQDAAFDEGHLQVELKKHEES